MWARATYGSVRTGFESIQWLDIGAQNVRLEHVAGFTVCGAARDASGDHYNLLAIDQTGALKQHNAVWLAHIENSEV
jgi:hypothetical protein